MVDLPLWKIWCSQLGVLFPIYGKIKNVPNHQPGYIYHKPKREIVVINQPFYLAHPQLWPPHRGHVQQRRQVGKTLSYVGAGNRGTMAKPSDVQAIGPGCWGNLERCHTCPIPTIPTHYSLFFIFFTSFVSQILRYNPVKEMGYHDIPTSVRVTNTISQFYAGYNSVVTTFQWSWAITHVTSFLKIHICVLFCFLYMGD